MKSNALHTPTVQLLDEGTRHLRDCEAHTSLTLHLPVGIAVYAVCEVLVVNGDSQTQSVPIVAITHICVLGSAFAAITPELTCRTLTIIPL